MEPISVQQRTYCKTDQLNKSFPFSETSELKGVQPKALCYDILSGYFSKMYLRSETKNWDFRQRYWATIAPMSIGRVNATAQQPGKIPLVRTSVILTAIVDLVADTVP